MNCIIHWIPRRPTEDHEPIETACGAFSGPASTSTTDVTCKACIARAALADRLVRIMTAKEAAEARARCPWDGVRGKEF